MKGVTVRGSIRNPKELASLVGRCNVFLYLSLPFCRQLINNKQSGDIEMAIGGMGNIGRMVKDAGKLIGKKKKRKPPKRFDAMTEGRKVGQAKKKIEAKKKRDKKFSDIGKSMVAFLQAGDTKTPTPKPGKRIPKVKPKTKVTGPMKAGQENLKTKFKDRLDYTDKKRPGKMGGGKIYASMDKKYGGGIYPRKPTNG